MLNKNMENLVYHLDVALSCDKHHMWSFLQETLHKSLLLCSAKKGTDFCSFKCGPTGSESSCMEEARNKVPWHKGTNWLRHTLLHNREGDQWVRYTKMQLEQLIWQQSTSWAKYTPLHAQVPPTGEHQLPLPRQTHPVPSKQTLQWRVYKQLRSCTVLEHWTVNVICSWTPTPGHCEVSSNQYQPVQHTNIKKNAELWRMFHHQGNGASAELAAMLLFKSTVHAWLEVQQFGESEEISLDWDVSIPYPKDVMPL